MPTDRIRNLLLGELKDLVKLKYDCKVITTPNFDDISENMFNEFSDNGWELVKVANNENPTDKKYEIIFRRFREVTIRDSNV